MVSSSQIKAELARFLNREVDLNSFEDWLIQNTWNIHLSGSVAAESLAFAIEESLAEYSSRHLADKELRDELGLLLHAETRVVNIADAPARQKVFAFRTSAPAIFVPVKILSPQGHFVPALAKSLPAMA